MTAGFPRGTVGLSTAALYPHTATEDGLRVAAEAGFGVVEVFLQTVGEYHPRFLAELQSRSADLDAQVYAIHVHSRHYSFWAPYRRQREEAAALFAEVVHMAASLGAVCIDWHGLRAVEAETVSVAEFFEVAGALGERAADSGVVLSIENVSHCWMRGAAEIERVRQAQLPVGFTFDPFQASEAGVDPLAVVAAMGDGLTNVHVSDYAPGRRHLPVGEGVLDWPALLGAIDATGYGGPLFLEAPQTDPASFVRQRQFLAQVLPVQKS
ncbi:MAG: sugar phosphate isomerase/epimerase [Anaerolineae bacterium]